MKIYKNGMKILSTITGFVLLVGSNNTAKAAHTFEIENGNGEKQIVTVPDNTNVKINSDGSYELIFTDGSVVKEETVSNSFEASERELSYDDYQTLCNDQLNEILRNEAEIKRIQKEYYRNNNFELNTEKLMEFIKSYVFITNLQLFSADAKANIISNDVSTDISVLIGNTYTGFTNFVDSYNQSIIREQEIDGTFDKTKLISCEYSFGNKTDRSEYIYARDTWFNSVKNGRIFNDDYYTLYCYLSNYAGSGLDEHYLGNATVFAQKGIYRTVGVDFKESYKVVFDEYLAIKENEKLFKSCFADLVTYTLNDSAKAVLEQEFKQMNLDNDSVALARESGDFSVDAVNICESPAEAIYHFAHICDNTDDFSDIMPYIGEILSSKTR